MSFQRDYILRVIEAFAQALANVAAMRRRGAYDDAREELKRLAGELFGIDLTLIEAVGPRAVAAQLDHPEKVARLKALLLERAEVERAAGDEAAAARWAGWAGEL